jgi:hypothetical protein
MVLLVVALMLAALAAAGLTAFSSSLIDLGIARNYKAAAEALAQAEAGAQWVLKRVRRDLDNGLLNWGDPVVYLHYANPHGFSFDPVESLTRLADNKSYTYRVTGRSGSARCDLDIVMRRPRSLPVGAFSDTDMPLGPSTRVYSYRSGEVLRPVAADSAGEAPVGVNESMGGSPDAVDGTIFLGEDRHGNPATYPHETGSLAEVVRVRRIDPDPLGVGDGPLADEFDRVAADNDNDRAVGGARAGGALRIVGDVQLRTGDYYVSRIDLGNHETLAIDAGAGPVNVYLTGPMNTQPNSDIVVDPPVPGSFRIYSNCAAPINFQPRAHFTGFIYAPRASIGVQPNGDFYGALWGRRLAMQPGGNVFIDLDFLDGLLRAPEIVSWKKMAL